MWKLKIPPSEGRKPQETPMPKQTESTPSGSREYVDPQLLFSLEMPADWLVDNSGQQGSKLVLFEPRADGNFRTNINVIVQELAPLTAEEYLTLARLQLKQTSGSSQLDVDQPAADAEGAHVFEVSSSRTPIPVKCRQAVWLRADKAFVVTGTTPLAQYNLRRKEIELVLRSFRILSVHR
jgi:hypothetical protein